MKPMAFAVVGLALWAAAGCRCDPAIPVLERELRLKEDEIYRLRAEVDELQECNEANSTRKESRSRRDEPESSPHDRTSPSAPASPAVELPQQPSRHVPDALKSPRGGVPSDIPEVPENLRGPSPKLPSKTSTDRGDPSGDGPSLDRKEDRVGGRPHRMTLAARDGSEPLMPGGDSRLVAAIALDRQLTGGVGDDDRQGDHGILVVVEPRDRAGRAVDAPADVSVAVLDPALPGEEARVARWDFTAAETAALFRRSGERCAIHLTMAWPGDPPKHDRLQLFVRYETADGRKLQADVPIEVALPGGRTARWSPGDRPDDRRLPPASRPEDAQSRRPVWSPERR
ncbi:MAG: hypothetical protein LLF97_07365 [Planctomycetaceae bacterium]|nr:hypothetical protein [Planctomycetaceae bacterium]